jgi:hypothetical protein
MLIKALLASEAAVLRRIVIIACLLVPVAIVTAQTARQLPTQGGKFNPQADFSRFVIPGKPGLNDIRGIQIGIGDQLPLQAPFRRNHGDEHGVPESHVNQALLKLGIIPALPLDLRLLKPQSTADECDAAQVALGSMMTGDNVAYLKSWENILGRNAVLRTADLQRKVNRASPGLLQRIADYSRACLSDPATLQPGPLSRNLSLSVGVLMFDAARGSGSQVWGALCSATRVDAGVVLTARHCFYKSDLGQTEVSAFTVRAVRAGAYKFVLPLVGKELAVTAIECVDDTAPHPDCLRYGPAGAHHEGFGSDFALLRVRESDGLPVPALTVSSAGIGQGSTVMLVGWNVFAAIQQTTASVLSGGLTLTASPRSTFPFPLPSVHPVASPATVPVAVPLRLSRAGTCTIATVKNVCMVHTCQSSNGASGAALLQPQQDGSLHMVGLHLAPTDADADYMGRESCDIESFRVGSLYGEAPLRYAGNIGLQLSP